VSGGGSGSGAAAPRKRADARRNEATLPNVAAAAFVESGVNVAVRDIAARARVGVGTIYRHFPTRADLIVAVYRHQVEACAEAGPTLLAESDTPHHVLARWIGMFIDAPALAHFLRTLPDHDDLRKVAYANAEALYRLESSLSVSNDETARLPGAVMRVGSEKRDRIL
jgi:AcrR family transcriptional regulator